ncbi:PEP-CTERM sorting domain-containing protein [Roseibacillus persicicus]|uniref:PEP-CTERM sorting domain-containing protein n=1 Tax=Roseibacillus persicicus TaxID=454148 RepID=UPI00398A57C8
MKLTALISAALGFSLATTQAVTTFDFTAPVVGTGTPYDGSSATGTLTYDESLLINGAPNDLFSPDASFTLEVFGQTFTQLDESEFGFFPVISFAPTGELAFTFIASELATTSNPITINAPGIVEFMIDIAPAASGQPSYPATLTATVVPEPSSALLLLGSLGLATLYRRR